MCMQSFVALCCVKKALGIFGPGRTDSNNNKKNNCDGVLGPAFRVQKVASNSFRLTSCGSDQLRVGLDIRLVEFLSR